MSSLETLLVDMPLNVKSSILGSVLEEVYVFVIDNAQSDNLVSFLKNGGFTNILSKTEDNLTTVTAQKEEIYPKQNENVQSSSSSTTTNTSSNDTQNRPLGYCENIDYIMGDKDNNVTGYIEIEQFSNIKYEYDTKNQKLKIDRLINDPLVYPYPYGFICGTIAWDGDPLDILIVSPNPVVPVPNDAYYNAYIIGGFYMEDEKGRDDKILVVLENDYEVWKDIDDVNEQVRTELTTFFDNYKKNIPNKFSKTGEFFDKNKAIQFYQETRIDKPAVMM